MKVQKACHVFKVLITIAMVVCFIAAAATISAFVSMYAFNSNVIFQMVAEELPDVSREETLAGILSMIGLYSVNLHIMGKANISLLRVDTVFVSFGRCDSSRHSPQLSGI